MVEPENRRESSRRTGEIEMTSTIFTDFTTILTYPSPTHFTFTFRNYPFLFVKKLFSLIFEKLAVRGYVKSVVKVVKTVNLEA